MKRTDNGKEYEEISRKETKKGDLSISELGGETRYFREVKPAPEFPIKIHQGKSCFYFKIDKDKKLYFENSITNNSMCIIGKDNPKEDINGILKALLAIGLTEDDIIKRLKELR